MGLILRPKLCGVFVFWPSQSVTKSGVELLVAQKPIKRQGWWRGKFALFGCQQTGESGQTLVQRLTPPHSPNNQWTRAFIDWEKQATCRNSTVSLKLVIVGLTSVILIVLSIACLARLFPFPWGQFSELWQLMSWLRSGHNVVNFSHVVRVSVSIRQLTGYGSEYYIVLKKELRLPW